MKKLIQIFIILTVFGSEVKSQTTLTIGQVYDYGLNDQFHYFTQGAPPNATRFTIIDKQISQLNDTVTYIRQFNNYSSHLVSYPYPHLEYSFNSYTDTINYTHLDSLISFQFNNWPSNPAQGDWFNDSSYISSQWCGIEVYEYSACIGCIFEGNFYQGQYGQGVGLIKEIHQSPAWPQIDYQFYLKYYKKGDVACGYPDLTATGDNDLVQESSGFFIFPNPVKSIFTLHNSTCNESFHCSIYNSVGQLILETELQGEINNINASHIKIGVYHLVIKTKSGKSVIKLVKE